MPEYQYFSFPGMQFRTPQRRVVRVMKNKVIKRRKESYSLAQDAVKDYSELKFFNSHLSKTIVLKKNSQCETGNPDFFIF